VTSPGPGSNELLGFPAEARLLIVNVDDVGLYAGANRAAVEAIEAGIASSCSLMVPAPAAQAAMLLLRERPQIPFGIHLTLVCDFPSHPWAPVAPKEQVPSLLDRAGQLYRPDDKELLLEQARIAEVELELRAQIDTVLAAGLAPTHLDWHCLADGGRTDLFDLTVTLAEEYQLAARVWLERGLRAVRGRSLPVVDHCSLDSFALDLDDKAARYAELLRGLPPGLSERAVHPAIGDQASRGMDGGWRVRQTDYEFLTSPQAREIVQREGIVIIGYQKIQQLWRRAHG
jgi:predicted glycoside hydrolase/deacetylase ChbG (UPF0249 family)